MKKGQTNNPNGRPKGKPNKLTADVKQLVVDLIQGNAEQLQHDFLQLEPAQRMAVFCRLAGLIVPRPKQEIAVEGINQNGMTKDEFVAMLKEARASCEKK